jgi:hypothetical protein
VEKLKEVRVEDALSTQPYGKKKSLHYDTLFNKVILTYSLIYQVSILNPNSHKVVYILFS